MPRFPFLSHDPSPRIPRTCTRCSLSLNWSYLAHVACLRQACFGRNRFARGTIRPRSGLGGSVPHPTTTIAFQTVACGPWDLCFSRQFSIHQMISCLLTHENSSAALRYGMMDASEVHVITFGCVDQPLVIFLVIVPHRCVVMPTLLYTFEEARLKLKGQPRNHSFWCVPNSGHS